MSSRRAHTLAAVAIATTAALAGLVAPASARAERAPRGPRVVHAPTAWVLPRGGVWLTAGATHRQGRTQLATVGLAGLAEVEVGEADAPACAPCPLEATFKLAAPAAWLPRSTALALGARRGAAAHRRADDPGAAVYLVTSAALGPARLHGGVTAWQRGVRPFAAVEWNPATYPRTTLLADATWEPAPGPAADDAADDEALRWIGGWGVRYQAFRWGSIELAVRHRQDEALGDATVLVRFNAHARLGP